MCTELCHNRALLSLNYFKARLFCLSIIVTIKENGKVTDLHVEDGGTVEDQVENQIPEGDQGHEVVKLVGPVHRDAQHKRQEVHLEQHLQSLIHI